MRTGNRAQVYNAKSSLATWAETKQPAPLLVKITLGPLIWAIKGAMNPTTTLPDRLKCLAGKLWTQCFQSKITETISLQTSVNKTPLSRRTLHWPESAICPLTPSGHPRSWLP